MQAKHSRLPSGLQTCSSRKGPSGFQFGRLHHTSGSSPHLNARDVCAQAMGSTYGTAFRVTTFGESHGKGVGCVVDGASVCANASAAFVAAC